MKAVIFPVAILMIMLVSGCSLPNPTITPEQNFRSERELAEDYFANPGMSPVLFQFATLHEETSEYSGFLVDRYGQIRTYKLTEAPLELVHYRNSLLLNTTVQMLLDASTDTGESIELTELARRVKAYHREVEQKTVQRRENPASEETISFYAYAIADSHSGPGCGGGVNASQSDGSTVLQLPLYVQGRVNLTNQSGYVEEMVQWLTALIPEQGSK